MSLGRHLGFRARLTAVTAGVFIIGGAALLGVQYLLVQQLFDSGIGSITSVCVGGVDGTTITTGSGRVPGTDDPSCSVLDGASSIVSAGPGGGGESILVQQANSLSREVLSGLLLWSVVVLGIFAALAVVAARWLAARSLARVSRLTASTRAITEHDLDRRLALDGPTDEFRVLGDTIDEMLDRLQEALRKQERFILGASHELRTPLTTARTALEIPLVQGRVPAGLEADVRRALAANERSERLITALLTLARSSRAVTGAVRLAEIVADVVRERHDADDSGDTVIRVVTRRDPRVAGDAALVQVAVCNLVDNALRHGRDVVVITVDADQSNGWAEVQSGGEQLDEDDIVSFIEPFNRGDATRLRSDGLGLGLSLVEAISRGAGGTLMLSPRDAGGLVARLRLPRID